MKRNISTISNKKPKLPKLDTENTIDYTKLLTSEDIEAIEIDDESELDNVNKKPEQNKSGKKSVKKSVPKDEKENKVLKKTKEKTNTINGIFVIIFVFMIFV